MISPINFRLIKKIDEILAEFARFLTKPEQKFVRELIFGILQSKRGLLSEIARHLGDQSTVKGVYQRIERNLGQYSFEKPYTLAQSKMLRFIDEDFLLIFDPSEVVKPFGKKMEGLTYVRDASEKTRRTKTATGKMTETPVLKPGYPLTIAIAMSKEGEIVPVELSLYAYGSEFFNSRNEETIKVIDTLIQKTNFKPTLILDREFDSYIVLGHLCELKQRFIVRVTENRKYRIPGMSSSPNIPTYTREEMIEKYSFIEAKTEITYSKKGIPKTYDFEFKAVHVELLSEQKKKEQFRERGDHQALTLIQMKIKKESGVPTIYLLTNIRPQTKEELVHLGRSYLARWNIEEYIRFLKQHFKMEEFLVRDLGRIKNLIQAFYIATAVIHLVTRRKTKFGWTSHHHLIKESLAVSEPKKSRDFFLYSYGMGFANIVAMNEKLLSREPREKRKKSDKNQLEFKI